MPLVPQDGGTVERTEQEEMQQAAAAVAKTLLPLTNAQRWRVVASMTVLYGIHQRPPAKGEAP